MFHRSKSYSPSATLFGRRLRALRLKSQQSQEQVGVSIGLDEGSARTRICRYECGRNMPKEPIAARLAQAFDVSLAYFFCPDDELARMILMYSEFDAERRALALKCLEELAVEGRS